MWSGDFVAQRSFERYAPFRQRVLSDCEKLKERPYLTGEEFTVADLLMTTVLREVRHGGVLERYPRVSAYRERCEARPSWQRTLDAYEQRLGVAAGSAR